MMVIPQSRWKKVYLLSLVLLFLLSLFLGSRTTGYAEPVTAAALQEQEPACPGEPMGVQATGVYRSERVPAVPIKWGAMGRRELGSRHALLLALPLGRPDSDGVGGRGPRSEAR